jgi:hypothetical protein
MTAFSCFKAALSLVICTSSHLHICTSTTVPKNIKGVKGDDGTNLLTYSTNAFQRGTVWNTFWPF